MRGPKGEFYPAVDFVRDPAGLWLEAVTGRSADGVPEDSHPDPGNPDRRVLIKEVDGSDDTVVAEYRRAPCSSAQEIPARGAATAAGDEAVRLDDEVLAEINAARTNPVGYAARLKGSSSTEVREAVEFLRRQSPLSPLKLQEALLASASRHAADQGRSGSASHLGTDGSTPRERVLAAGARPSLVGEAIAFDADTAMGVARQLIVDHGVRDRSHRVALFNA